MFTQGLELSNNSIHGESNNGGWFATLLLPSNTGMGINRFTGVILINNKMIIQEKNCHLHTHSCKPTFAHHCIVKNHRTFFQPRRFGKNILEVSGKLLLPSAFWT